MEYNKGDKVYIISDGKTLNGTIISRVEKYYVVDYKKVNGDGYYVEVDYGNGSGNGVINWTNLFNTDDITNWTRHIKRDEILNDILGCE